MKIKEKINLNYEGLIEHGPITIVAFGDSVTHGAVGAGEIFYDTVYHQLLKEKINAVRNYVPVNVINAGIGGITAKDSIGRIDSQVLCHNPDLVIVCFGLNDVNRDLDDYLDSLRVIFERCSAVCDVIFLTPNMLNTYVAPGTEEKYLEYAALTAKVHRGQNGYVYGKGGCTRKGNEHRRLRLLRKVEKDGGNRGHNTASRQLHKPPQKRNARAFRTVTFRDDFRR